MFLGEHYTDLDIVAFHPEKGEILVSTRDKQKNLFLFNYRSLLYKKIASGLVASAVSPDGKTVILLSEKNKLLYFSETGLEIIQMSLFSRTKIDSRRDLNAIVDASDRSALYLATYTCSASGAGPSREILRPPGLPGRRGPPGFPRQAQGAGPPSSTAASTCWTGRSERRSGRGAAGTGTCRRAARVQGGQVFLRPDLRR